MSDSEHAYTHTCTHDKYEQKNPFRTIHKVVDLFSVLNKNIVLIDRFT